MKRWCLDRHWIIYAFTCSLKYSFLSIIKGNSNVYRWFRLVHNGDDYKCLRKWMLGKIMFYTNNCNGINKSMSYCNRKIQSKVSKQPLKWENEKIRFSSFHFAIENLNKRPDANERPSCSDELKSVKRYSVWYSSQKSASISDHL